MAPYLAESERLWLQTLNVEEHLDDLQAMLSDARGHTWTSAEKSKIVFNRESTAAFIEETKTSAEKPWSRRWAIILRPSNRSEVASDAAVLPRNEKPMTIGVIGLPREGEIGYRMHPDFWRMGYMTEALGLAINLFWAEDEDKKYDKLLAAADPDNLGSIRLLEKFGFQKGEYIQNFYERVINGEVVKAHMQNFFLERPAA